MAKKSSSKEESAPSRDLLTEGRQAIQLMGEAYPAVLGYQQQYGPDYARAEVATATARANAESDAIAKNYAGWRGSMMAASPEVAAATQAQIGQLQQLGPSAIETEANRQALADLKLGRDLSPEQIRDSQQGARAAASSRGLAMGMPAAVAEVMNRDAFATQRQNERRNYAAGVDAQSQQRRASDASIANNVGNSLYAQWDPQMRFFGRGGSMVTGQVSGPSTFTPFLTAAGDVGRSNMDSQNAALDRAQQMDMFNAEREDTRYYTDLNARVSEQNAARQAKSSSNGAWLAAGGAVLGALIGLI